MSTSDRHLTVLDLFTLEQPYWSVEEGASALGFAISTTYRYFKRLNGVALIIGVGGGRYGLGPAVIRYDRLLRLTDPLILAAGGELDRIANLLPGSSVAFLSRLFGEQVICVAQSATGNPPFAIVYERGRPMPLFAGSASHVILANLPNRQLRALYRREPASFAAAGLGDDWASVSTALRTSRSQGARVGRGELNPGMRGVSAPILARDVGVFGSITLVALRETLPEDVTAYVIEEVKGAASKIEFKLQKGSPSLTA